VMALGKIGPSATMAIPALNETLATQNNYLRGVVATAIWRINGDVDTALPVLLRTIPGESEYNKWDWIVALGEMGPKAKDALPQLQQELMQDKQKRVLQHVTNALLKIDADAAAKMGVFPPAPDK
jgi:hypothetical protein